MSLVESAGIEYLGLHYGGADTYVRNFDPKIAEQQLRFFMSILSDDQARKIGDQAA